MQQNTYMKRFTGTLKKYMDAQKNPIVSFMLHFRKHYLSTLLSFVSTFKYSAHGKCQVSQRFTKCEAVLGYQQTRISDMNINF
jgi:hypothetical protein